MNPDVSIIIVSYNVQNYLQKCLESIYASPIQCSFEIIIIDNASSDLSSEMIQNKYPHIKWIQNQENLGFAAANNQGIRSATGNFIWLLNPDTEVLPDALDTLKDVIEGDSKIGACGSKLINEDGSLQISCYPFPTLGREFVRMFHLGSIFPNSQYPMDRWDSHKIYPVDNLQGASLLLRKSALEEVGVLDEAFFVYTEEVDLNYRLKKAGWKIFWVPNSIIIHHGGQSTKQNKTVMFLELYKTKIQFFRKHYGKVSTALYKLVLYTASLIRILSGGIKNLITNSVDNQTMVQNYTFLIRYISNY